jgi:hypothetical protein
MDVSEALLERKLFWLLTLESASFPQKSDSSTAGIT